jgi:predicted lipoprotein with Yx(FWY)xxD motif
MRTRIAFPLLAALIAAFASIGLGRAEFIEFPATNPAAIQIPAGESIRIQQFGTKGGAAWNLVNELQLIFSAPGAESTNSVNGYKLLDLYINGPATITAKPVVSAYGSGIPYQLTTYTNSIRYDGNGDGSYSWWVPTDPGNSQYQQYLFWLSQGNTPLPADAYTGSDVAESGVLVSYSRFTNQPYGMLLVPVDGTNNLTIPDGQSLVFANVNTGAMGNPQVIVKGYTNSLWPGVPISGPEEIQIINPANSYMPGYSSLAVINYSYGEPQQDAMPSPSFVEAIANGILAASNNHGIATKADLGIVASNTLSQVQSDPNSYNLFTLAQKEASYDEGITAGASLVTADPASYSLYTQTQYEAHRIQGVAQGKAEVTNNPTAYSLFTESSIMDMNMGGLMLKKGADANELDLELTIETKDSLFDNEWQVAERIARKVSMDGAQRQFLRVRAGAPYVAPNVKVLAHPTLGNILTDGAGRVIYFFAADSPGGNPLFSGSSWPYVTVPEAPKADAGVSATLASSTFGRPGGPYLTVNGRPAYYYVGDAAAGQANGHGLGYVWWTIRADGVFNQ